MNKLDFAAINQALDPESVVPQWLSDGKRRGKEWVASNPTRNDRNPGSFTVNLLEGNWKDFATGDGGADLVSLYAYLFHGNDQGQAAHELAKNHGVRIGDPVVRQHAAEAANVRKLEDVEPQPIFPIPATATAPRFWHPAFGTPDHTWEYRDREGQLLMFVCRFNPPGERKQIIPYTWCKLSDGTEAWKWRGIKRPKRVPLFGLNRLAAVPEADAIVVEGEKATDAGQRLFMPSGAVVCSWLGGIENADRANVAALAGRRVILWPDFDSQREKLTREEAAAGVPPESKPFLPLHEQPGVRAMMALATMLKGVAREVIMVGYTVAGEFAHGWDLADAEAEGWTTEQVAAYMAQHAGDPWHIAASKPPAPPAAQAPTLAPVPQDIPTPPAPVGNADNDNTPRLPLEASVNPFGWPHLSDKGQPMNTVENLAYLLGEYGITARYNIIKKDVVVHVPSRDYGDDSAANCALAEINSMCARNRMPKSDTDSYLKLIGTMNRYNPAADLIHSRPWDGVTRLPALYATLETAPDYDRGLMELMVRRWLVSAVAAALMPTGFWSKGVLVLQGDQSLGKTAWIKSLLPKEHRDLIKIGASIDPANKDSVCSVIGHWVVELGELDGTFRKADIARLKAFISQDVDQLRRPYDRLESAYQRRTVFFASVNPEKFLADETGNVRWWTVPVVAVDDKHDIDVQQLWAEVAELFAQGERWWLERDEEARLEVVNREHEAVDPLEERILQAFDWSRTGRGESMTATDVLLAMGYDKPSKSQATDCSRLLQKMTGEKPRKSGSRRLFRMPPRNMGNSGGSDDGRPI